MYKTYKLKNIVGSFYTQGEIEFHPQNLTLYSPIKNSILKSSISESKNKILNFQTQGNIEKMRFDRIGDLLIISDSQNRVYLYNTKLDLKIGQKTFSEKISKIEFSKNNKIFFIISSKFVYIYKKPENINNVLLEPFFLIKKYNSKSKKKIFAFKLGPNSTSMILANDDNILRIVPIFPENDFNTVFELKGHKAPILDFLEDLSFSSKILTLDKNGLTLIWELVNKEEEDNYINFKHSNKKIKKNITTATNLTKFEKLLKKSKFILKKKELIYQEGQSIHNYIFENSLLLINFKNLSFSLYSTNLNEKTEIIPLTQFKLSQNNPNTIKFHHKKPILACGISKTGEIIIWDWRSKQYLLQQRGYKTRISAYKFNFDCSILAIGDFKGNVKIFNTENFLNPVTFTESDSKITGIEFINTRTFVTSSLDGLCRIYDLVKYKCFREIKLEENNQFTCLDVEKEGEVIFLGGFDPYSIYLFSYKTGKCLDILNIHTEPISFLKYCNSSQNLISVSWDKTIRITKIFSKDRNSEEIFLNQKIMDIKISRDEKKMIIGLYNNEIQIYDIFTASLIGLIDISNEFERKFIKGIEINFDFTKIFTIGNLNSIFIYDFQHRSLVNKINIPLNLDYGDMKDKKNSKKIIDGFDFENLDFSENDENELILPGSRYNKKIKKKENLELSDLLFSQDGRFLCVVSNQGLLLFSQEEYVFNLGIKKNITKKNLIQILKENKYVEFFLICLELQKIELLKPIFSKLEKKEILSIINLLTEKNLKTLLKFISENFLGDFIEDLLIWFKFILMLKFEIVKKREFLDLLRNCLRLIKEHCEDFYEFCDYDLTMMDFLQKQIMI